MSVTVSVVLSMVAGAITPAVAGPRSTAGVGAQTGLGGLSYPDGFTFFPDGRILFGERFTGRIRIYDPTTHATTTFFTVPDLTTTGEQGLLGLAVAPGYPATPCVFAFASRLLSGFRYNQILRITDSNGKGTSMKVIASFNSAQGDTRAPRSRTRVARPPTRAEGGDRTRRCSARSGLGTAVRGVTDEGRPHGRSSRETGDPRDRQRASLERRRAAAPGV